MKKKLLAILPLLLSVIMTNAQDVTTYRGAFAPAPERQWTESWTNWDPKNTVYPVTNVNVSGSISANTTWTSNNVYLLQGLVYVDSLVTLTIQPGTIIRGTTGTNASLIIRRGAKLMAEGTVCNPIVFTSNEAAGNRTSGDWGGVILLGKAKHNLGTNNVIEGLSTAESRNYHGGTDDNDNSGVLKYVRIEFSGYIFSANNEINSLTMGSVGRGTTIDYVQTSYGLDDSFEWFGGSVNCKHLVAYRGLDDDFDTDNGYSGIVQYALGIKDPALSDVSNSSGFESDNDNPGTAETRYPKTSVKFYNVTQIGAFRCASNANASGVVPTSVLHRRGARLRRNSDINIFNSILMNNWRGLFLDGTLALNNTDQDSLRFRNNIIAGDFTTTWTGPTYGGTKSLAAEDAGTRTRLFNVNYSNDSVNTCSLLVNAWDFLNPDFRPNTAGAGALVTDPTNLTVGADLTTYIDIDNTQFTPSQAYDFIANVFENGGGATSGIITVIIAKSSGWDITVPGLTLTGVNQSGTNGTSNVFGGTSNNNGDWFFRQDAGNVYATSKAGVVISKSGLASLGFIATRKVSTSTGTNQNLGITIGTGSGGDNSDGNNNALLNLSTSN